ncbi:DUF3263 domain-containing protein [Aeromicrobium panaciterrae]|uniref:DUF3263 domain-containing protein n=1 Tax=Aeromicrobium panaciterrae TaxID=363861 RepID=UPI0031DA0A43
MPETTELSDRDKALIDIFSKTWRYMGPKETAVREATGLSLTGATQIVNRLIDTEAALAYKPTAVNRLRRIRDERKQNRLARPA